MPHCRPRNDGRTAGRNCLAFSCSSQSRLIGTCSKPKAAVLLDCRPSSCRSSERVSPAALSGMARTNGEAPSSSIAAATTKPPLRRLVTQCRRPARVQPRSSRRPLTCSASIPERYFMALDSPVAPASWPLSRSGSRRSRSPPLGLCSRYSIKARWPQNTKAAAREWLATLATVSTASATVPPLPPRASSIPTRSTCAAASCPSTACGSPWPWSRASAWASSHATNAGSSIAFTPLKMRQPALAPRVRYAEGCQRYLLSSSLSGVWANTLAKLHRVARLTPRITSRALPSL
ncbi:hypothetical protein D3C80_1104640 [compost metagenome]